MGPALEAHEVSWQLGTAWAAPAARARPRRGDTRQGQSRDAWGDQIHPWGAKITRGGPEPPVGPGAAALGGNSGLPGAPCCLNKLSVRPPRATTQDPSPAPPGGETEAGGRRADPAGRGAPGVGGALASPFPMIWGGRAPRLQQGAAVGAPRAQRVGGEDGHAWTPRGRQGAAAPGRGAPLPATHGHAGPRARSSAPTPPTHTRCSSPPPASGSYLRPAGPAASRAG